MTATTTLEATVTAPTGQEFRDDARRRRRPLPPAALHRLTAIDGWRATLAVGHTVLTIAVLLRWMDSFLIYAEPFALTGGGPGNTTTFLSIYLVKLATMQFDLGPAAAFSLIYFVIILLFSFAFYQALLNVGRGGKA